MSVEEKDPLAPDADRAEKLREIKRIAARDEREAQRRLETMSEEEKRRLRETRKNLREKMSAGMKCSGDNRVDE